MNEDYAEHYGFQFKIDGLEAINLTNGEKVFVLYLIVDNKTQKARSINLLKATYVTAKREQIEQENWITGYISGEDIIKPNSFKKAGLVFYKARLKTISENDFIYVSIELIQEGVEMTLCFQKNGDNWLLLNNEKAEIEIKLTAKQLETKFQRCIERLEAFEDRLNVYLENISIKVNNDCYLWNLLGEIHTKNTNEINETLSVVCIVYNSHGSIVMQQSTYILKESFYGFEVFRFLFKLEETGNDVSKIRIYPTK